MYDEDNLPTNQSRDFTDQTDYVAYKVGVFKARGKLTVYKLQV